MMQVGIRSKVLSAIIGTALLMLVVAAASLASLQRLKQMVNLAVERALPAIIELQNYNAAAFQVLESISTLNALSHSKDLNTQIEREEQERLNAEQELQASVSILSNILSELSESNANLVELQLISNKILALRGKSTFNIALFNEEKEDLEEDLRELVSKTSASLQNSIEQKQILIQHAISAAFRIQSIATLLCLCAAVVFALILSQSITKPLIKLKKSVDSLGNGDFDTELPLGSNDEVGQLANAFSKMVTKLRNNLISRQYLDDVMNSMNDLIFVVDREHYIRMVNRSTIILLNKSQEFFLGKSLLALFPNLAGYAKLSISTSYNTNREIVINSDKLPNIYVSVSASPLLQDGTQIGTVYVMRDVSDQKRANTELLTVRERLSRSEHLASLGAMGGTVAHRLNQPLTTLRLFIQQSIRGLDKTTAPDWVLGNLNESLEEIESASRIVKEILGFTRRPCSEKTNNVDLSQIAYSVINALQESSEKAGLRISTSGFEKLPLIYGAADDIEEILFILIQNAIQQVPFGNSASLEITASHRAGKIILSFKDSCGGIKSDILNKIFDVFFTTKPRGQGTGLGLSILKQLVTDHAGEVAVVSEESVGTTFTITLPTSMEISTDAPSNSIRS